MLTALRFRVPRADRAHNYLYVRLNNCGEPTVQEAATLLHDLRSLRNAADYDVQPSFLQSEATGAIDDAEEILRILDALSPAERTQITDAIKRYEQTVGDVTWTP